MIITIKNPINDSDIDIEVAITTKLITHPNGSQELTVAASGSVLLSGPTQTLP
jgi:hypothetical protein